MKRVPGFTVLIALFFTFSIFMSSCIGDLIEYFDSESYPVKIVQSSDLFEKYGRVAVMSYDSILTIQIHETLPERYFPKDSNGFTMEYTHFYAVIYPDPKNQYGSDNAWLIDNNNHTFESTSSDWNNSRGYKIRIPYSAFYFIPHGKKQTVYLKIYQVGCPLTSDDCRSDSTHLWATIKTELNIPQLYKTTFCTDSIVLRDDSVFSPVGMDFSFRLGLPDIYWYFTYNAQSKEDGFSQNFRSREATYAVLYPYQDTVSFIHYKKRKNIDISVWDRDDLSRDDFIGEWKGSVDDFKSSNNDYTVLKFDNIDRFKIKVLSEDVPTN